MSGSVVTASAGEWGLVGVLLLMILAIWGLYALWIVRHGARWVEVSFPYSTGPDEALRDWVGYYSEWLASNGWAMTSQGHGSITYWRRYFPSWSIAVAVLLFPLGLLALLARTDATLVVTAGAGEGDRGTRLDVRGKVQRRVAKELESDAATEASGDPVPG